MDEFFESNYITVTEVSTKKGIAYTTIEEYLDGDDYFDFPQFEHPHVVRRFGEELHGSSGATDILYAIASAPTIAALASMINTFLLRNKNRRVVVDREGDDARVEITGDFSTEEIETILRAGLIPGADSGETRDELSTASEEVD